jgi:hypothetical protein
MYVHWQKRRAGGQVVFWAAVLVRNVRVRGMPTKQHVAYLAGIAQQRATDPEHRARFWEKSLAELDMQEMSPSERRKIEAALAERVRCPPHRRMQRMRRATSALDPQEIHERELELEEEHERDFV